MKKLSISLLFVTIVLILFSSCAKSTQKKILSPTTVVETISSTPSPTPSKTTSVKTIPVDTSKAAPDTTILVDGLVFPECPRWHDGKLWFSDMHANKVMTVDMDGKTETIIGLADMPAGLGWDVEGRLLVVSMDDRHLLRLDSGNLTEVADLSDLASGMCNDTVVDALGRAYIGNFGLGTDLNQGKIGIAEIVMVAPDGKASIVAVNMIFPNGSVVTPDGRTLIVAETLGSRLVAFDIEDDGSLSNQHLWAKLDRGFYPDGICLDAEGAVWVANVDGKQVVRIIEGGKVTQRVNTSTYPYACALGGPDLRTLYITAAETDDADESIAKVSGRIETIKVDVPGAAVPRVPEPQTTTGFKVSGAVVSNGDTRPDSSIATNGIWIWQYNAASNDYHGGLEGIDLCVCTIKCDTNAGIYAGSGEGTFTGTVNGKKGNFTYSFTCWGNFLTSDSGIGTYHYIILSGTEELKDIHGTITYIAQFSSKTQGTYSGMLSFDK
jgi:sugar lactone lactonase YvrE